MLIKKAAIGGEQESNFESSLATIAYTYIADKAPGLVDYMVGFQLVDRNNDNTKSIGIFGFKIAKQWLYVPVFFLNGDVKGHELLYLKNQDMFVPLKENWINYLVQKKPSVLGSGTDETLSELGVRSPNYESVAFPPFAGKTAGDRYRPQIDEWLQPILPKVAEWITQSPKSRYPGLDERLNLTSFLKDLGLPGIKLALDVADRAPELKSAVMSSVLALRDSLEAIRSKVASLPESKILTNREKKAAASSNLDIRVSGHCNTEDLTNKQKEQLLKQGYLVIDKRAEEDISVAYTKNLRVVVNNPEETGKFPVLTGDGEFEDMIIILHPYTGRGRARFATVIRTGDSSNYLNAHSSRIFVKQEYKTVSNLKVFSEWYDDLSAVDKNKLEENTLYVAVSKSGSGTAPFVVNKKNADGDYDVTWRDYTASGMGGDAHTSGSFDRSYDGDFCCGPGSSGYTLVFNTRRGTSFKQLGNTLYVPEESKVIRICSVGDCYDRRPIRPGSVADLERSLEVKTASVKVWMDSSEVVINHQRFPKLAGFFHLIRDHGFRESDASFMMKEAERKGGAAKFLVKYAATSSAGMGPGSEVEFEDPEYAMDPLSDRAMAVYPQTSYQQLSGLSSSNTDLTQYDPMQVDEPTMQAAQQAYQTGQKELLDTSMISSMLKAVREDSIVDKYLGDLMRALDRLGRILFLLYWHGDDFEDRYGKHDMPELEDTTRNAFEVLGDLVLFLRQKTVDPVLGGADISEPNIVDSARN